MYKRLFMGCSLLTYSFEKMFKALQIMLPKMKRKTQFSDNSLFCENKPSACIPYVAVTNYLNPNSFFNKNIRMVILK